MLESLDTLHYHFHLLRVSLEGSVCVCDFFADPDIVSSTVAPSQKSVWAIITLFTDLPTARITLARLVFFSLLHSDRWMLQLHGMFQDYILCRFI